MSRVREGFARAGIVLVLACVMVTGIGVAPGAPANDDFANRIDLGNGDPVNTAGSNVGATLEVGEPDFIGAGGASVWWSWTAPADGWFEMNTAGSSADSVLYVFKGLSLGSLTQVAANDDDHGGALHSRSNFEAMSGETYQIAVHGWNGAQGSMSLEIKSIATPPFYDSFNLNYFVGNSSPAFVTGVTNVGATLEGLEPDSLDLGGSSVWFRWIAPSSDWVQIDTVGSDFDTILYVFTESSPGAYTEVASNDDDSGLSFLSRLNLKPVAGQEYRIAVHGFFGAMGNINLLISPIATPPVNDNFADRTIIANPVVNPTAGDTTGATLEGPEPDSLDAGGASVWYEWTAPAGGWYTIDTQGTLGADTILYVYTGSTLESLVEVVSNDDEKAFDTDSRVKVNATMGEIYQIAVHGFDGDFGSFNLNISPTTPAPANDLFANRIDIGSPVRATAGGSNVGATLEGTEDSPINEASFDPPPDEDLIDVGGASVWWSWTSPVTGMAKIDTVGSDFDTVLYVSIGESPNRPFLVAADDDFTDPGDESQVIFPVTAGTTYQIAVNGWEADEGTVVLNIEANDDFNMNVDLGIVTVAQVEGGNVGGTVQAGEPDSLGIGGASVWWSWTAPAAGMVNINTFGSAVDTVLYVYTGNSLGALTEVDANDNAGGTLQSRVQFTASIGQIYRIAVHGKSGATGPIGLSVSTLGPYDTWLAGYPSLVGPLALPTADGDGDGLANLVELALGTDPRIPSLPGSADPNGGNAPEFIVNPGTIELRFRKSDRNLTAGVGPAITITGIWSPAFQLWTVVPPISLGGDLYKVEVPIEAGVVPAKYLSLMVED